MRIALITLVAACGRIGFDPSGDAGIGGPDAPRDASPDATTAIYGGFANPVMLGVNAYGSDPQLRNDGLELWVVNMRPSVYDLEVSTRATTSDAFSPVATSTLSTAGNETDPQLDGTGMVIMYLLDLGTQVQVRQATRASTTQAFGASSPVPGLEALDVRSIELLPSGNVLYVELQGAPGVLTRYSRTAPEAPFGTAEAVDGIIDMSFITVTADELLLFGNVVTGGDGMVWATRASTAAPWTQHGAVAFDGCTAGDSYDADITSDGKQLVLRCPEMIVLSRP